MLHVVGCVCVSYRIGLLCQLPAYLLQQYWSYLSKCLTLLLIKYECPCDIWRGEEKEEEEEERKNQ